MATIGSLLEIPQEAMQYDFSVEQLLTPAMRMRIQTVFVSWLVPNPLGTMRFTLTLTMVSYPLTSHVPNARTSSKNHPAMLS